MRTKTILIKSSKSKYSHNLNEFLRGISEIKILGLCLPNSNYLINKSNNIFEYYVGDQKTIVELDYQDPNDVNEFCQLLENKLNEDSDVEFTISFDNHTYKVTITTDQDVKIKFNKGLAKILGFNEGLTDVGKKFEGENVINFNKSLYYSIIFEDFNHQTYYYNNVDIGYVLINETERTIKFDSKRDLGQLKILILDDNDQEIDFNGVEWSMIVEISYEQ